MDNYNNNIYANVEPKESGYNNSGAYNQSVNPTPAYGATNVVKCPGKEITGMVLGICAVFYGAMGVIFCWYFILAFTFGLCGIGCGVPAIILYKQVMKTATVTTKKTVIGKNLGIAGIICGAAALVLGVIFIGVIFGILGVAYMDYLQF